MKKILAWTVCLLLMCSCACAQVLPDAGAQLDVRGQHQMKDYVFSNDYVCDVWIYPRDERTDERLPGWIMQVLDSGYTVSSMTVEGQVAYRLEAENGLYAMIFPQYQGAVMLMVQQGMDYAPAIPTPTPTAQATAKPAPIQTDPLPWDWVWVEVEKDCPSCINGKCSVCNGSGVYRLYGQSASCPVFCSSCDGTGVFTTWEYQQIFH